MVRFTWSKQVWFGDGMATLAHQHDPVHAHPAPRRTRARSRSRSAAPSTSSSGCQATSLSRWASSHTPTHTHAGNINIFSTVESIAVVSYYYYLGQKRIGNSIFWLKTDRLKAQTGQKKGPNSTVHRIHSTVPYRTARSTHFSVGDILAGSPFPDSPRFGPADSRVRRLVHADDRGGGHPQGRVPASALLDERVTPMVI